MKTSVCLATLLIEGVLLTGCDKPNVVRVNSPTGGVFLTVETHHGQGAISNDFTRIYAHFESKGKSDKELVLDGEYLEDTKIMWLNPSEVTFCVPYGSPTESFRNNVTLHAGDESWTLHSRLQEHCNSRASEAHSAISPDKVLFDRAKDALQRKQFDVANLDLQTLVNTYPTSDYVPEAKSLLQDPRIAGCGQFSTTPGKCGGIAQTRPLH